MLKLALPNGSLEKNTTELFAAAGWSIEREDRSAMASTNCPFAESIFFTRPQAIPRVVSSGLCDVGICGYDCVAEARLSHELEERSEWPGIITFLPYSKKTWGCTRIVLCSRKNSSIQRIEDVSDGSKVYTEYPALTEQHFREHGIHVQCIRATGSVEGHVRIGEFEVGATVLEEGKTCDKTGRPFKLPKAINKVSNAVGTAKNQNITPYLNKAQKKRTTMPPATITKN